MGLSVATLSILYVVMRRIKSDIHRKRMLMSHDGSSKDVWEIVVTSEGKVIEADSSLGLNKGNILEDNVQDLLKKAGTGGGFGSIVLPNKRGELKEVMAYVNYHKDDGESYTIKGYLSS